MNKAEEWLGLLSSSAAAPLGVQLCAIPMVIPFENSASLTTKPSLKRMMPRWRRPFECLFNRLQLEMDTVASITVFLADTYDTYEVSRPCSRRL
ncbi:hypothetical protein E2562_032162 [Oryza meyeriana var. granulata]|uniref:Uncharacterized protein n=1 Tax=Oryza meyeriana var. granulata TaxID=110450 RepID=A0A6G1E7G2_9ORYZ|nr:hypothetical protein E2562_032162 [Oryza meyeriana var. granulata]